MAVDDKLEIKMVKQTSYLVGKDEWSGKHLVRVEPRVSDRTILILQGDKVIKVHILLFDLFMSAMKMVSKEFGREE